MKAITLTQPWATLVAIGAKRWETRSWRTNYRGPLAIHAAKGYPAWARELVDEQPFYGVLHEHFQGYERDRLEASRGHVIAIVNLLGCWPTEALIVSGKLTKQEAAFGDYAPCRFGWRLDRPAPIEPPEPAKGALGLWEWEPSPIVRLWLKDHYPEVAA